MAMEITESKLERREKLMQAVGALWEKGDHARQQLVSMETEIACIETEIASIDAAPVAETKGTGRRRRRVVSKKASQSTPYWALHAPMNPALWSTFPMEIQQLVFARLPWPEIMRLRLLSKQWNRCVSSENPEFLRVCTELNPRIFAMINRTTAVGTISVRMYDINTDKWHDLTDRVVPGDEFCWTMCAGDGGLVCHVTPPGRDNVKKRPLLITVRNPLTRQYVNLPSHDLCSVRPRMVQLVMDRERKFYKVIIVGKKKRHDEGAVAQIFSSETRSWSSATASAGLIFGHAYRWFYDCGYLYEELLGPCAYDCAKGQLVKLKDPFSLCTEQSVTDYELVKDRLFVLHEEEHVNPCSVRHENRRYCISEYRGQKEKPNWVKLKVHRCEEFELPPFSKHYSMHLKACKGFLLVLINNGEGDVYNHELTWLYNLSTGVWQALPHIPECEEDIPNDALFELRWDAVP